MTTGSLSFDGGAPVGRSESPKYAELVAHFPCAVDHGHPHAQDKFPVRGLAPLGLDVGYGDLVAGLVFIGAALTDTADGYIARKHGLVTNMGKFIDPLADKILVTAALISLVELQRLPAWIVAVIVSREFMVTGLRMVAAAEGVVIAASWGARPRP